jgi:hypothetical protein
LQAVPEHNAEDRFVRNLGHSDYYCGLSRARKTDRLPWLSDHAPWYFHATYPTRTGECEGEKVARRHGETVWRVSACYRFTLSAAVSRGYASFASPT